MIIRKFFKETVFTISDDDYEYDPKYILTHGDTLELGGYTWTRIGELQVHDMYLCDDSVKRMAFNSNGMDNRWETSDIRRWLNNDFYNKLSHDEKEIITKNRELNDNIFLLSKEEYNKFKNNIPLLRVLWRLRSPGNMTGSAAAVYTDGDVCVGSVGRSSSRVGVRPALLV